ncbi:YoaK family protein [Streptomyces sp. NPDC001581]|uniref:YoaK family protein n=1 Tax=Streptomyces sp. NPDC001581 TaxID=3154386 RepID=UPI00331FC84C
MSVSLSTLLGRVAARMFPKSRAPRTADGPDGHHGVLPPLLVLLTFVTGLVDAVSYLGLGRVFVANMTGNVVFLGFSLAGDRALSATASLLAIGAFMTGAMVGGQWVTPRVADPLRLFAALVGAHAVLVAGTLAATVADPAQAVYSPYPLIAVLALGMGLQNAVVARLAVPDLTTTVLTRTLTGLAADRLGPAAMRRTVSVVSMLLGALAGGLLQLRLGTAAALAPAAVLLAAVAAAAAVSAGPPTGRDAGRGAGAGGPGTGQGR